MPELVIPSHCVFEYAAKVACGIIAKEPVPPPIPPCVPGYYATAVNIHNPSLKNFTILYAWPLKPGRTGLKKTG